MTYIVLKVPLSSTNQPTNRLLKELEIFSVCMCILTIMFFSVLFFCSAPLLSFFIYGALIWT